ncbi:hypothetical protein B4589_002785 [Halolamina sp. CBA1230]|uniref:hypothetical protein n=1 Tax=Halolamina sp. CBA1230 TaxID=1853690 RepID=UPI001594E5BC|nr:hypothetical protein [Halolamina sp. CBA1230]QKY19352.1 hypothetical protein B4589_002785 [Halolamina sp. CBA1230]
MRDAYGVRTRYDRFGIDDVARRSVFVLDADGTVTYRWLAGDPGVEPDSPTVADAVRNAAGE